VKKKTGIPKSGMRDGMGLDGIKYFSQGHVLLQSRVPFLNLSAISGKLQRVIPSDDRGAQIMMI